MMEMSEKRVSPKQTAGKRLRGFQFFGGAAGDILVFRNRQSFGEGTDFIPMRTALLAVCVWISHALPASAGERAVPDAIYRFEVGASLEKLNLLETFAKDGKPCSFTRQESDGSVSRVIVCSDKLATYLATLQVPSVMLTFKLADNPYSSKRSGSERTQIATIHGKDISFFPWSLCVIRKDDQHGKVAPAAAVWIFLPDRFSCH